jgi:hypothetical protein
MVGSQNYRNRIHLSGRSPLAKGADRCAAIHNRYFHLTSRMPLSIDPTTASRQALRANAHRELAELTLDHLQQREDHWAAVDRDQLIVVSVSLSGYAVLRQLDLVLVNAWRLIRPIMMPARR